MRRLLSGLASLCLIWGSQAHAQFEEAGRLSSRPSRAANRFIGDEEISPAAYQMPYGAEAEAASYSAPSYSGPSCTDGACGGDCCGWNHGWYGYGEFLYLRARGAEVPYAAVANGPAAGPVPGAPVLEFNRLGVADFDYNPGFRAGFGKTLDCYSAIGGQFTWYDANTDNQVVGNQLNNRVVVPLLLDPGIVNAAAFFDSATARSDLSYRLADLDYRFLALCGESHELTVVAGLRYAQMTQNFNATYTGLAVQTVDTNIDFTGYGARFGLEGERALGNGGLFVSGKGYASLLAGEFNANYRSNAVPGAGVEVDTDFQVGRLATMVELELGMGWRNCNDTIRVQAGYVFNSWYNMLLTKEWVNAVQNSNFVDPSTNFNGMMAFDGITGRVEFRY